MKHLPLVTIDGVKYRKSFTVSLFHGGIKEHKIKDFYFVSLKRTKKVIELSNGGGGSFKSFLDRRDAYKAAIEYQKSIVKHETDKLLKMETDFKAVKKWARRKR